MTIQGKATKRYFPMVLFIMLYKVVLAFESVGEIRKCEHPIFIYLYEEPFIGKIWCVTSSKFGFFVML